MISWDDKLDIIKIMFSDRPIQFRWFLNITKMRTGSCLTFYFQVLFANNLVAYNKIMKTYLFIYLFTVSSQ